MTVRACLLVLVLGLAVAPLRAQQDEPVHMRPEFALTFPLAGDGESVTVKYPVLVNGTTEVKPGMQLRVLYMLSVDSQSSNDLALAHEGSLENSYARDPAASAGGSDDAKMPPELAHEIEGYRRTVWTVPNNFVMAMAQYPTEQMHLIYAPAANSRDLHDAVFHFFDGLFMGSPGGQVTVVAVEKESPSEQAGLKAGDVILAVGAYPTHGDLMAFTKAYSDAKQDARDNEAEDYTMTLRGADGTPRTAKVAMPLKLKGGLMDGFSTKP